MTVKILFGVIFLWPILAIGQDYKRSEFGWGWADNDKDCQNTRHEILIERSLIPVSFKTHKRCRVASGQWVSLYTSDKLFHSKAVDIDHLVSLKWAWDRGAKHWPKAKRIAFANDPDNLLIVEKSLNRSKGTKDITEWLPQKNQCVVIRRFVKIVDKYALTVNLRKQKKILQLTDSC